MNRCLVLLLAATVLALPGCSCGGGEGIPLPEPTPQAESTPAAAPTVVRVTTANTVDPAVPADQVPEGCTPGPRTEGSVRVDADRGLADVIAWLRNPVRPSAASTVEPIDTEQSRQLALRDCRMTPRSLVATQGDTLVVTNGDDRFHTVHLWRMDGGQERSHQTIALPPKAADVRFDLDHPGLYRLRSDQIPWMRGLLLVHGARERGLVTGPDGSAEATGLPLASWDVELVHETLGSAQTTVEITDGTPAAIYGTLPGSE